MSPSFWGDMGRGRTILDAMLENTNLKSGTKFRSPKGGRIWAHSKALLPTGVHG